MGHCESGGNPERDVERPIGGERLVAHERPERLAADELHHDERHPVLLADVVDRRDVRVVERRGELRFLLEALSAFGVGRHFGG